MSFFDLRILITPLGIFNLLKNTDSAMTRRKITTGQTMIDLQNTTQQTKDWETPIHKNMGEQALRKG